MDRISLQEGCKTLLSTINQLDNTQRQMDAIERSYFSAIKENQLIEYKSVKSKFKLAMESSIAFGAVFSLFLMLVGGAGLLYLILYAGYYGYRLIMSLQKKQNNKVLDTLTIIMFVISILVIVSMFLRSIVVGIIMAVIGVIAVLIASNVTNKRLMKENEKIREQNRIFAEKNRELTTQYKQLAGTYSQLIKLLNQQANNWMPAHYLHADALNFFLDCLAKYRADTLKELINLYEAELRHREDVARSERQHEEQIAAIRAEGALIREQQEYHHQQTIAAMDRNYREITAAYDRVASAYESAAYEINSLNRHLK